MIDSIQPSNKKKKTNRFAEVRAQGIAEVRAANDSLSDSLHTLGVYSSSGVLTIRARDILRHAFFIVLALICLSMLVVFLDLTLGLSLLLVTASVIQLFAYWVCMETGDRSIDPFVLPYTTVITLILAAFTFALGLYNLYITHMT